MHTIYDKKLLMIRPEELQYSANRIRTDFNEQELKMLAQSIAVNGIIHPLAIRRDEEGRFELIAGRRRLKAAIIAGLRRVPCILYRVDRSTAALYSVTENIQRSRLSVFEEAQCIDLLIAVYGMSKSEISARLGVERSTINRKLELLELEENIRSRLRSLELGEQFARELIKLPFIQRKNALDKIIAEDMSVTKVKEYVENYFAPIKSKPLPPIEKPIKKTAIGDLRLFSNSLTKLVQTLKDASVRANLKKTETDKYIEYKVRIEKDIQKPVTATQLKIC